MKKMEAIQLNQKIADLVDMDKTVTKLWDQQNFKEYKNEVEKLKSNIAILHNVDPTFKSLKKQSILILLRLNSKHRAIKFHNFGLDIVLDK